MMMIFVALLCMGESDWRDRSGKFVGKGMVMNW